MEAMIITDEWRALSLIFANSCLYLLSAFWSLQGENLTALEPAAFFERNHE